MICIGLLGPNIVLMRHLFFLRSFSRNSDHAPGFLEICSNFIVVPHCYFFYLSMEYFLTACVCTVISTGTSRYETEIPCNFEEFSCPGSLPLHAGKNSP